MTLNTNTIYGGLAIAALVILLPLLVGINNAGHRTVIQYPNGYLVTKFEPGIYMQWFGRSTVYMASLFPDIRLPIGILKTKP